MDGLLKNPHKEASLYLMAEIHLVSRVLYSGNWIHKPLFLS